VTRSFQAHGEVDAGGGFGLFGLPSVTWKIRRYGTQNNPSVGPNSAPLLMITRNIGAAVITGTGIGAGHRFAADGYTVEILQPYDGLRRPIGGLRR
jgi:hypothetical protein